MLGFPPATSRRAFTMVEILVVVAIIGILTAVVYANFSQARAVARDNMRKNDLKNLQLAIELYKETYGEYPASCTGNPVNGTHPHWGGSETYDPAATWLQSCPTDYIVGLVPEFIAALPTEPGPNKSNRGYIYGTNATSSAYKLMAHHNVESLIITAYSDPFARYPSAAACGTPAVFPVGVEKMYAVYSAGAQCW
jgi:prepilin-type N-terminal cleavage/methylation domain-containing protein